MMAIDPRLPLLFKLLWLLLTSLSLPFIPWTSPLKRPLKSWNSPLCLPCLQIFQLKHPKLQHTGYLFEKPSSRKLRVFPPALPPLLLTPFFFIIIFYFSLQFEPWDVSSLQPVNYPGFQYICIQQHAGSYQFICCALQPFSSTAAGEKTELSAAK